MPDEPAAAAGNGNASGVEKDASVDHAADRREQGSSSASDPTSSSSGDASSSAQPGSEPGDQAAPDAAQVAAKPALRMPSLPQRPNRTSKAPAAAADQAEPAASSTGDHASSSMGNSGSSSSGAVRASSTPSTSAPGTPSTAARPLRASNGGRPAGMPALPPRVAPASAFAHLPQIETAVDPAEPPATQRVRARVHDIRVGLIRAAQRLGYSSDNGIVKQVGH